MTSLVRRRVALLVVAVLVVVTGLTVHRLADGWIGGFTGDALYAVLMVMLVAIVVPRAPSVVVGGVALAVCVGVELLQLTGVPALLSAAVPGVELVLGTTFQATDLLAYALGALGATFVDLLVRRRAAGSSRGERTTPSAGAPEPRP
ncbi:DUF2809 domain-containing protein [Leifsonia shinshuensis]|uniref:ribosomal maturation YjgA family protein n=1 Tax=Leifsonia shinshuensis TaxID=150026 RepID=UPI001F5082CB|nr:DUF2809 domain-containing protein [Leifsonia shinshuensis]MCI0155096.1 DUF2809 domain-containing protein [Leifsonia shinshuensis]